MRKRFLAAALALAACLGLAAPALAADGGGKDFSQYLTGEPLKKEELTLGGRPFYEMPLEEAKGHIPALDGSGTHTYVAEWPAGQELTEYNAHLVGRTTNGSTWNYRVVARQLTGSDTLFSLDYNGGDLFTGELHRFETGVRGIATGDDMAEVLEKLGLSRQGAELLAEELISGKTNFDFNEGKTYGSSHDNYGDEDHPEAAAHDMPKVQIKVDGAELALYFLNGRLSDLNMHLILPEQEAPSFTDVPEGEYYAAPVAWAVEKGITNGTSDTAFSPNDECTEAQILTFLWRAKEKPEIEGSDPFPVSFGETEYFYKAARWANDLGMIDPGQFDPDKPCTRAQAVRFIWMASAQPDAGEKGGFTDVPAGADYADAVSWAVEKGITNGTSDTTFSPGTVCSRGQIVTFLHRAYAG